MNAEILIIADEVLSGTTQDTNSKYITNGLNTIGIRVNRISTVGDNKRQINGILNEIYGRVDLLLITGGLGPTSDDLTVETLAEYFNKKLIFNPDVLKEIENKFAKRKRKASEAIKKLANLPENTNIIPNEMGIAPGLWFRDGKKQLFALPGVPYEAEAMFDSFVINRLKQQNEAENRHIMHKNIMLAGIGETRIAEKINKIEKSLPFNIKLSYLPTYCTVKLRLTASGSDKKAIQGQINEISKNISELLGNDVFSEKGESLPLVVSGLLRKKKKTLAIAESCTGGLLSGMITEVTGASEVFSGAVVAYSNKVKTGLLKVSPELIKKQGAVSKEVAESMLSGIIELTNADVGIAVTGIAGPGGGTAEKPVGTVWIAAGSLDNHEVRCCHFTFDRKINNIFSSLTALDMLRKKL
jgi:nicotinamide-nucleotide amidase